MKNFVRFVSVLLLAIGVVWLPFAVFDALDRHARERSEAARRALHAQSTLRIGVMTHPTVYYTDPNGERVGLEYDLVSAFATTQKSEAQWHTFKTPDEARAALARGELDVVAIGTSAGASSNEVATKTKYHESAWILLHAPQKFQPKSLAELVPKRVVVSARIASHPLLIALAEKHPQIQFVSDSAGDDESMMAAIGNDEIPYA
ncbi:MAG: transporter substrate-binding domain-containing protein, partial [Casimicrobium sp.]